MKEFNLIVEIPYGEFLSKKGIVFTKFLPRESDAIKIKKDGFESLIYFSYDKKHLNHVSNDFLKSQKKIKHFLNIEVNTLMLKVKTSISNKLYNQLGKGINNQYTEEFSKKVMSFILVEYKNIFNYVKFRKSQFWLEEYTYELQNFSDFFLKLNAIWDYNGTSKRFHLKNTVTSLTINLDSDIEKTYISKKEWSNIGLFISKDNKIKTEELLISNSLKHLDGDNGRLAIIEISICLEYFVKSNKCANLKKIISQDELKYINKLFSKELFSIPLEIILHQVEPYLLKESIDKQLILNTIELRNNIMHNAQKNIDLIQAYKSIKNIIHFINFIKKYNNKSKN